MVYLHYISCLRYTILVGNSRNTLLIIIIHYYLPEKVWRASVLAVVLQGRRVSGDAAARGMQQSVVRRLAARLVLQTPHAGRQGQRLHRVQAAEPLQATQGVEVRILRATGVAGPPALAAWSHRIFLLWERGVGVGGVGAGVGSVGVVVGVGGVVVLPGGEVPADRAGLCCGCLYNGPTRAQRRTQRHALSDQIRPRHTLCLIRSVPDTHTLSNQIRPRHTLCLIRSVPDTHSV